MTLVLWPKRQHGCLAANLVTSCQESNASLHAHLSMTKLLLVVCKQNIVM